MIIDAKDSIVGRIATIAAKKALLGEEIEIVNCEQAVVTGKKEFVIKETKRKKEMGTFKGPFIPRMPDRYVRRIIRGMLPYKQEKGREAYKRIKCHIGIPEELSGKDTVKLEKADVKKIKNKNYVSIGEICKKLGKELKK